MVGAPNHPPPRGAGSGRLGKISSRPSCALLLEALIGGRHGGGLFLYDSENGAKLSRRIGEPQGALWEG